MWSLLETEGDRCWGRGMVERVSDMDYGVEGEAWLCGKEGNNVDSRGVNYSRGTHNMRVARGP